MPEEICGVECSILAWEEIFGLLDRCASTIPGLW